MTGRASGSCASAATSSGTTCDSVANVVDISSPSQSSSLSSVCTCHTGETSAVFQTVRASSLWSSAPAASGTAGSWRSTKAGRRSLATLRLVSAGDRLTSYHHFAFLQIAFNNFRRGAISQPHLDTPRLQLAVLAQHPNEAGLAFQHRRAGGSKVARTSLLCAGLLCAGLLPAPRCLIRIRRAIVTLLLPSLTTCISSAVPAPANALP